MASNRDRGQGSSWTVALAEEARIVLGHKRRWKSGRAVFH
jgi:hypothetical protein